MEFINDYFGHRAGNKGRSYDMCSNEVNDLAAKLATVRAGQLPTARDIARELRVFLASPGCKLTREQATIAWSTAMALESSGTGEK